MKITDYPRVNDLVPENVVLVDGPDGTKTIATNNLARAMMNAGGANPVPFTISQDSWRDSTAYPGYKFEADLYITGLDPDDLVRADFDMPSLVVATAAQVAASGETSTGLAVFYSTKRPTEDLTGVYTINRRS